MSETRAKRPAPCHIRWTIRRDVGQVAAASAAASGWSEEEFLRVLRQRNCIAMIAERGPRLVGHAVYRLNRGSVEVLQFWAADRFAAAELAEKLVAKAHGHRRPVLAVPYRAALALAGAMVCSEEDPGLLSVVVTGAPAGPLSDDARLLLAARAEPEIVADKLQDDGCEDDELLAALRAGGAGAALIARALAPAVAAGA